MFAFFVSTTLAYQPPYGRDFVAPRPQFSAARAPLPVLETAAFSAAAEKAWKTVIAAKDACNADEGCAIDDDEEEALTALLLDGLLALEKVSIEADSEATYALAASVDEAILDTGGDAWLGGWRRLQQPQSHRFRTV